MSIITPGAVHVNQIGILLDENTPKLRLDCFEPAVQTALLNMAVQLIGKEGQCVMHIHLHPGVPGGAGKRGSRVKHRAVQIVHRPPGILRRQDLCRLLRDRQRILPCRPGQRAGDPDLLSLNSHLI